MKLLSVCKNLFTYVGESMTYSEEYALFIFDRFIVFNTIFSNISAVSWRPEEAGVLVSFIICGNESSARHISDRLV
jgi:hypothetical protein